MSPELSRALRRDLVAGLCVAGLLLPEAVAYAGLAQVPVAHALTACLLGLLVYACCGGSRFAIVAPTSSSASLAAAAALSIPAAGALAPGYGAALTALVLLAGAILLLLAWGRQGQLSGFVSRPVLRGFAFALAISIVIKQLPDALGLAPQPGADPLRLLLHLGSHLQQLHLPSVGVALSAALGLALLRRWPQLPASLLVIVLAIAAARGLDLRGLGVHEVGALARPDFRPVWPQLSADEWLRAGELAFGLVVLIFSESWGSVRTFALRHGERPDANRELAALGLANIASALLQGLPVGAGFSATAANEAAGAKSRWAGAFAMLAIVLALWLALPALHLLPRPVLAVAVISALWHSLSPRPLLAMWRLDRDRWLIVAAVLAVLLLGVLHGMLTAIALSLIGALRRFSQPVVHELAQLDETRNYVVRDEHPEALVRPGLLILRPEEPLFFASAERVVAEVLTRVQQRRASAEALHAVVLSLEESGDLDVTALECLLELRQRLRQAGCELLLARVKEPVRELLARCDPQGLGRAEAMFWSVADAAELGRAA
ncbi:SulP family inorganic anion transporter [Paucibacter sp. APW11]|uniref:SulP family inorganic anion transporter n=1 Tax=Roseateles aquae TaxID=3077235 RepID=A0ABU3P7W6_9BURK|nr:SulP family inorganic anion transporter [Paucibacter sp. APW11]MDT8998659.1 SulP family inorganic anion transporter [Paucibacter sp. APW11]